MKLLLDGKNPLACNAGLIFETDTISATSNPKYAPKVLYNSGTVTTMAKNYNPYSNYYNQYTKDPNSGYGIYSWKKKKLSDAGQARSDAKVSLARMGHKVKFISKDSNNHLMVGTCKYCQRPAYLMFIPFAGEYVEEGKAFDTQCVSVKKVSTVIKDSTVLTPLKTPEVLKGGFDVKLENYPLGIVGEMGYEEYS